MIEPQSQNGAEDYLDIIFAISRKWLNQELDTSSYQDLINRTSHLRGLPTSQIVKGFTDAYLDIVKKKHQSEYLFSDTVLNKFISQNSGNVKAVWGDCQQILAKMDSESVHLMVTSPPYYNAREYSQWDNLHVYLQDMQKVVRECWRVLDNHRAFVFNVGDITGNDNLHTRSSWGTRRIPLGAYFISMFEEEGFTFVDDIIWDKGEVQSQRHKNAANPYPLYQYPVNCYEHILVFYKHRNDETRYPCPVCGCLKVNANAYSGKGIKSWECKNFDCFERSAGNRGKRFSLRSITMNNMKTSPIDADFIAKWRRDITKISPVIKINSKGDNILGHTAPFPAEIPEFAVKTLSRKGDVVVDPFAGSFSSGIEAVKLGRIGVGFEVNKEMFRTAVKRNISKNGMRVEEYDLL